MKFQLKWSDNVKAVDPRIKTEGRTHTYQFEAEDKEAAEAVVTTFMRIIPRHDFRKHELTVIEDQ